MYRLKWKGEIIEDDIKDLETARYLQREYALAYGSAVTIERIN